MPPNEHADGGHDARDAQNHLGENEDDAGMPQRSLFQLVAIVRQRRRRLRITNLIRFSKVNERPSGDGDDQGQRQRPLDVVEDAHDADEDVEKSDPNGEQQRALHENSLEDVNQHEKGAADDVRRAEDAEHAGLGVVQRWRGGGGRVMVVVALERVKTRVRTLMKWMTTVPIIVEILGGRRRQRSLLLLLLTIIST